MRALQALPLLLLTSTAAFAANDQENIAEVDGYTDVSPSDLTILKQASPAFPKKAIKAGYEHEECVAQLFVDVVGKVEDVQIQMGCPDVFHKSVLKAAKKWRFEPYTGFEGEIVPVTFALRFRFQRDT